MPTPNDVLLFTSDSRLKADYMLEAIKNNPVRVYSIIAATLALVVFYVPSIPTALVLALVAAVLGTGGEITRTQVTPIRDPHDDRGRALVPKAEA